MDVIMDCPLSVEPSGTYVVEHFRSWRTSKMFFRDPLGFSQLTEKEQENQQGAIRTVVENVRNYVNAHGGWTIVGWFCQGEVSDEATNENVTSMNQILHISLLTPTNTTIDENALLDRQFVLPA